MEDDRSRGAAPPTSLPLGALAAQRRRGRGERPADHTVWPVIRNPRARSAGVTTPVAKRRP
jgi:hypothetical protein